MNRVAYAVVVALLLEAGSASASTIVANAAYCCDTGGDEFALGQSVTTPSGGPWNTLTFHLVDSAGDPYANGSLYLLTQVYAGTAAGLSSSTAGFLASTGNTAGGLWTFAPGVTLQANTAYWFYMDTYFDGTVQVRFSRSNPYSGGVLYQQDSGALPVYTGFSQTDLAFSLQGTEVTAVPEPATLLLLGTGLGAVVVRRRQGGRA